MSRTFRLKCVASVWQARVAGAGVSLGMPMPGEATCRLRSDLPQRPERAE